MIKLITLIILACGCCVGASIAFRVNPSVLRGLLFLLFASIVFTIICFIIGTSKIIWTESPYYDKFNRVEYIDQIYVKPTSSSILIPFDSLRTTPYGKNE